MTGHDSAAAAPPGETTSRSFWRSRFGVVAEVTTAVAAIATVVGVVAPFREDEPTRVEQILQVVTVPSVEREAVTVAPQATVTQVVTTTGEPATSAIRPTRAFDGRMFSISYPASWQVVAAEEWQSGVYMDTTIVSDHDPRVLARVDVMPSLDDPDPLASAEPVRAALAKTPGYTEVRFDRTTFGGYDAVAWEFTNVERGTTMRKLDLFFTDGAGNGFAILTQAPAAQYETFAPVFEETRASLRPANP